MGGTSTCLFQTQVGVEGKLGGAACVEGIAGTWKDLTYGVLTMAANYAGAYTFVVQLGTSTHIFLYSPSACHC